MIVKELGKDRTTRKSLVRKLDKIVSEIVILRDGKCICCGTDKRLTCGHLFSRVAYSTRWDLGNCYAQCLSCNFRHELDAYPMINKVISLRGVEFVDDMHRLYTHAEPVKTWQMKEIYDQLVTIKKTYDHPSI